jgi:hypothetical protein
MKTEEEYDRILNTKKTATTKPVKKPMTEGDQVATGCGVFVLIGICFMIWLSSGTPGCAGGSSSRPSPSSDDALTAWTMAQSFVERHLKAPSTAKYPWGYSDRVKSLGGGRYLVNAYVDSQNSFGAQLRSNFTATLRHAGGDSWVCEYLEIDGQVLINSL